MTEIQIEDRRPRETYAVGATAQAVFTVPFPFFAAADIRVYVGGVRKTLGTDYTVTGAGTSGGTVTLTTAVSNTTVAVVRRIPIDRLTDFPSAAGFKVPALNRELDRHTAIAQQIADDGTRSLRPPENEDFDGALPALATRQGRVLGFDADGQPAVSANTLSQIDAYIGGQVAAGGALGGFGPLAADGTTATFDTGYGITSAVRVVVFIGGAPQQNFTVSGQNVILPEAPPAGVEVFGRVFGVTPGVGDNAPPVSHATAQPLGTASGGASDEPAAVDHVHALPTAAQVGAAATVHSHPVSDVTGLQAALDGKADATATTSALALKAPLASPTFTGAPAVPTAANGTNTAQAASTAFVQAAIALLVNSSPSTLDTLNELAAALGNDPNFATTVATSLGLKAPLASPALTGTPTAPTAATATDTTQLATTAFVQALAVSLRSSTSPAALAASAAIGSGTTFARADHAHQRQLESIVIKIGDETSAITAGTSKVTFRMAYAFTLTDVRAGVKEAQTSGSILTFDINEAGASILSTKLTIDNNEKTSTTAATPRVISDTALADDAEITIDVDQVGTGATGGWITLIGRQSA